MTCTRCCGLMVTDHYMDPEGTAGHTWLLAWRCMNCGHVHDSTVERNRTAVAPRSRDLVTVGDGAIDLDEPVYLGADTLIPLAV